MTPLRSSATAGPDWSPERVLRLDAVNDSGAPVGHEQSAAAVNRERERVVEARREDRNPARVATPVELDAHDSAAEAIRVVLAPFGDVEVAPPEGQTVCGGVRCEIRHGRRRALAVPDQPKQARARPAGRPAVPLTFPDDDDHLCGFGIVLRAEEVLTVH